MRNAFIGLLFLLLAACTAGGPAGGTPASTVGSVPSVVTTASGDAAPLTPPTGVAPQPGDSQFPRGNAYLDTVEMRPDPNEASAGFVHLAGSLPTPCHRLRAEVIPPDANNRMVVVAYSLNTVGGMCAQVLAPFDVLLPVQGFSSGRQYVMFVNGHEFLKFEWPLAQMKPY